MELPQVDDIKEKIKGIKGFSDGGKELLGKCLNEFVGTFIVCFTVACAGGQSLALAGLAQGTAVTVAMYMGYYVSGAHYNPAISLAQYILGKLPIAEACLYCVSQLFAGIIAGALALPVAAGNQRFTNPNIIGHPATSPDTTIVGALVGEIISTFAIVHVYLHITETTYAPKGYYGLVVGLMVASAALSVGEFTGGSFNPAMAMLTIYSQNVPSTSYNSIWISIGGPLTGAFMGAGMFSVTHPQEVDGAAAAGKKFERLMFAPYFMEILGSIVYGFIVATSASINNHTGLAPVAIGFMLVAMTYATVPSSGGHLNPAITLAYWVRSCYFGGKDDLHWVTLIGFIFCHLFANFGGAALGKLVVHDIGFPTPGPGVGIGTTIMCEFIATFFLVLVYLQVISAAEHKGNGYYGIAIGFTLLTFLVAIGNISGGCLNPAVGLSSFIGGTNSDSNMPWLTFVLAYLITTPIAGLCAACFFRLTNAKEFPVEEKKRPKAES